MKASRRLKPIIPRKAALKGNAFMGYSLDREVIRMPLAPKPVREVPRMNQTARLTVSAMFLAIGLVLPFLTGQIPRIGSMLLPMHLPALLCGFVCGPLWGLVTGMVMPLLRSLLFQMPVMVPMALAMAFELGAYGLVAGLLNRLFPKKTGYVYLALAIAMVAGRIAFGLAMAVILGLGGSGYSLAAFFTAAFVQAVPGLILQFILVPLCVAALRKAHLIP